MVQKHQFPAKYKSIQFSSKDMTMGISDDGNKTTNHHGFRLYSMYNVYTVYN